jgi:ubiquinone/menaquinone biosynthesis C-methylase UbiE
MADGFFSHLDIMNYIQHHHIATQLHSGDVVLDVCCGRGLMLPLIRYIRPNIARYIGVDIDAGNISEITRWSGAKRLTKPLSEYYPFPINLITCVAEALEIPTHPHIFDVVIYTSSIEHMQKEAGIKSLEACWNVMHSGSTMYLSCPNTTDKKDPYDTQYAAHLYEWGLDELRDELKRIGFAIQDVYGLTIKAKKLKMLMQNADELFASIKAINILKKTLPTAWLLPMAACLLPAEYADEVMIVVKRSDKPKMGRLT